MKKITACVLAAFLAALLLLPGCGNVQTQYLKAYSSTSSDDTADMSSMIPADTAKAFASDLAVVSVADATSTQAKDDLGDVDASEAFLAGTTDNRVIKAYNIYKTMPPASITKILTALVALESGKDLDQEYTLTNDIEVSVADAQLCGFQVGDVVTLRTLLYCMLVYSGNDAANAVASAVSDGDISAFVSEMNAEAKRLGATQTNFVTPNGLDTPNHYTTAYDLYLIFKECLKYDVFVDAIQQSSYTANFKRDGKETSMTFPSTNYYKLGNATAPSGITVVGGKTGNTDNAGVCLILYCTDSSGNGYISVLLGSPDKDTLYSSMTNLLSNINN